MLRPGEVIEKEGYDELLEERQISEEFVTVVPATNYGSKTKQVDSIVKALTSGSQKISAVEKIIKYSGCTLVKPFGLILDNSNNAVILSDIIAGFYKINTTGPVRCPVCGEPFTYDEILFHLESKYKSGHKLQLKKIIEFFRLRWYSSWRWRDGKFEKD